MRPCIMLFGIMGSRGFCDTLRFDFEELLVEVGAEEAVLYGAE